jgi:hypothetical protein
MHWRWLSNRVFDSYDAILDACYDAWLRITTTRLTQVLHHSKAPAKTGEGPKILCCIEFSAPSHDTIEVLDRIG